MQKQFDICVIGGGINGSGIAAEASRRGLKTILFEQNDFASATSSASSKLIHGGLRYLEYYEFRLVHEALKEREVLLKLAPHIIQPLKFILPYSKNLRPFWLLRLGLWLYDYLYWKNSLPKSRSMVLSPEQKLAAEFTHALVYYDCQTEDTRLVLENLLMAYEKGAEVYNYTKVIKVQKCNEYWLIQAQDQLTLNVMTYFAKVLINASGPWLNYVAESNLLKMNNKTRLVKGSHLLFKKFYEGDHAYIFQTEDQRVVFTIPYHKDYLLVGTTDIPVEFFQLTELKVEKSEKTYLCNILNHYFSKNIKEEDCIFEYWGIRSLLAEEGENPTSTTRDYKLDLEYKTSQTPLLHIVGGKITTFRALSEHALDMLQPWFPTAISREKPEPFPGGRFENQSLKIFLQQLKNEYPFLDINLLDRFLRTYGVRTKLLLESIKCLNNMGNLIGDLIYEREIDFLVKYEWVKNSEDLLMRRTRLGMFANEKQKYDVQEYFNKKYKSFNSN